MRERERRRQDEHQNLPRDAGGADPDAAGDGIDELRDESDRLLDAAGAAIGKALSGDSTRFLQDARQRSGQ